MASTAPGLASLSSLPNTSLLDRHVLEHRLDHDVGVLARAIEVGGAVEQRRCACSASSGVSAPRCTLTSDNSSRSSSRPRFSASSPVSTIVTGMPALAKLIEMPPPMVPAPITAARLISRGFTSSRHVRHLRGLALGEEDMALRLRLLADDELRRTARARASAPRRSACRRVAHRFDRGGGRVQAARLLRQFAARSRRICRGWRGRRELVVAIAHAPSGRFSATTFCAKAMAPATRSPSMISSTRPAASASFAGIGSPRQNHRQRLFDADEPRQALRAAGARNEAELDFRQAEPRARRGDAEMAAERHLEPAAERRAVHGRDRRLLDRLDRGDHVERGRAAAAACRTR